MDRGSLTANYFFCLQYRGAFSATVCSFQSACGFSIWPPDVGVTASCTAAPPEVRAILQPPTEAFFERMSFVGMGGIEFKRDGCTGEFLMIEPHCRVIDSQEEVAILHDANIPLAAYLHEIGLPGTLSSREDLSWVIWRDYFLHSHVSAQSLRPAALDRTTIPEFDDAYRRRDRSDTGACSTSGRIDATSAQGLCTRDGEGGIDQERHAISPREILPSATTQAASITRDH